MEKLNKLSCFVCLLEPACIAVISICLNKPIVLRSSSPRSGIARTRRRRRPRWTRSWGRSGRSTPPTRPCQVSGGHLLRQGCAWGCVKWLVHCCHGARSIPLQSLPRGRATCPLSIRSLRQAEVHVEAALHSYARLQCRVRPQASHGLDCGARVGCGEGLGIGPCHLRALRIARLTTGLLLALSLSRDKLPGRRTAAQLHA